MSRKSPWMAGSIGVSSHWTADTLRRDGSRPAFREAVAAFNAGVGQNFVYTDRFDYYAGEAVELDEPFHPEPLSGKQDHRWICLDSKDWVFSKILPGIFRQPLYS